MAHKDVLRFVVAREPSGPWWRRWRWALEDSWTREPRWRLKASGYGFTLRGALQYVHAALFLSDRDRVEGTLVIRSAEREQRPVESTPLPPELLGEDC
jgi:hypothetical protein